MKPSKHKYTITIFKYNYEVELAAPIPFWDYIQDSILPLVIPPGSKIMVQLNNKTYYSLDLLTNYKIGEKANSLYFYWDRSHLGLYYDYRRKLFSFHLDHNVSNQTESDQIKFIKNLWQELTPHNLSFNVKAADKAWLMYAKTASKVDVLDYYYATGLSLVNIYPEKSMRDQFYLPLPDEFYLSIPASKVERIDNGIWIQLTESLYPSPEELLKAIDSVSNYYKTELVKRGLWGQVKWSPDWREKYRDFLFKKGFIV